MANLFILAPYPSHRLSVLLKHQSRHIKCAGILDYLARRGRMGDKPKFRPQTCAPNHGKSQNKLDVNIWNIARLRRLGEGDGAMDRNFECNLVFVDCGGSFRSTGGLRLRIWCFCAIKAACGRNRICCSGKAYDGPQERGRALQ